MNDPDEVVEFYTEKDGVLHITGATQRRFLKLYRHPDYKLIEGKPPATIKKIVENDPVILYPPLQEQLLWLWQAMDKDLLPKYNDFYLNLKPYLDSLPDKQNKAPITGVDLTKLKMIHPLRAKNE